MKNLYKKAFGAIEPSEQKKQETMQKLINHKNEMKASGETKAKKHLSWNIKHCIVAASTATVLIFCAIFIPIIALNHTSGSGGSDNSISEKARIKAIFEKAIYIPALNDIMPASVTNAINLDDASTAATFNAKKAQPAFSQVSTFSPEEIKTMDISELNGDYSQYFESLLNRYNNVKDISQGIKFNSVSNLQYVSDFNVWVSIANDTKIKYEQTDDAVIYYYAYSYNGLTEPTIQKAVVYNDGSTECFYWRPEEANSYFRYNGKDNFVTISEFGGEAYYLEMKKEGENFIGVDVSLASSDGSYTDSEGIGKIQYMQGDASAFYTVEYNFLFDESQFSVVHPSEYNWIGIIKDKSTCILSNNGGVMKGTVILSMDALDGIDKIYYSEEEYGYRKFEALKTVSGEMYYNSPENPFCYGMSLSKPAPNVYSGWFEISLLDIDDYSEVMKIYNDALPLDLKIKQAKEFDFSVYPVLTAEIENYKITGINAVSDLVLIENGDEVYTKIVEYINAMHYEVP